MTAYHRDNQTPTHLPRSSLMLATLLVSLGPAQAQVPYPYRIPSERLSLTFEDGKFTVTGPPHGWMWTFSLKVPGKSGRMHVSTITPTATVPPSPPAPDVPNPSPDPIGEPAPGDDATTAALSIGPEDLAEDGESKASRAARAPVHIAFNVEIGAAAGVVVSVVARESGGADLHFGPPPTPRTAPEMLEVLFDNDDSTFPARTLRIGESDSQADLLQTIDGVPSNTRYNSIFNVRTDLLLQASTGDIIGGAARNALSVRVHPARDAVLTVVPQYFETVQHLPYYAPFASPFPRGKIHTGWMGRHHAVGITDEEFLLKNLGWLRDNLQPFGVDVFQMDMDWWKDGNFRDPGPKKFQHDLKWLADQVTHANFIPGIRLAPWKRDESMVQQHPDWFLHDGEGRILRTAPSGFPPLSPLLDTTNPQAANEMSDLFHTLRDRLGFHYFQLDGQGTYWSCIRNAPLFSKKTPPLDAYRAGFRQVRRAVGDDFLLNSGEIVSETMGIANGSYTGEVVSPATAFKTVSEATSHWLFLNRNCWFTDPGVFAVGAPDPIDETRAWASFLALAGQMLMLDDELSALDPDRVELLKRVIPVVSLRPVDLYPKDHASILDARFTRPWGEWDVVGLFNDSDLPLTRRLDLAQLGIDAAGAQYAVYDFWAKQYLGLIDNLIPLEIHPHGCRVVCLRKVEGTPQVLSTSRHISQGGVEIRSIAWDDKKQTLNGVSDLVAGDPYTITILLPQGDRTYSLVSARSDLKGPSPEAHSEGAIATITFTSPTSRTVRWQVIFK